MSTKKVLLVDDDPDIRKIGRLSLTGVAKWEVILASTGEEALVLAATEKPDVILLDSTMPDDSTATLAQLKRDPILSQTPVIMTGVKLDNREMRALMNAGAKGVLDKPFNPRTLPLDINKLLS